MRRAGGRDNGPVGAIYQANVAGGGIGKGMQEGKVTRVEVWGDLLQVTRHVRIISPVEHRQGWKLESHDILGHDVRGLLGGKEGRRGSEGGTKVFFSKAGCGTSSRSRNDN